MLNNLRYNNDRQNIILEKFVGTRHLIRFAFILEILMKYGYLYSHSFVYDYTLLENFILK